jgi:hypothetical protein
VHVTTLETTLEEQVHQLNSQLHALALQNASQIGAYFDRSGPALSMMRDSSLSCCFGDRMPLPPALIPQGVADHYAKCFLALRAAINLIFDGRLEGSWKLLAEELRLEEVTLPYIDQTRRPRWLTIARPDVIIHDNDVTLVEPNGGSSVGYMPDGDILGRMFDNSPIIGDYLREHGARRSDVVATLASYLTERLADAGHPVDSALILLIEFRTDLGTICDDSPGLAQELRRCGLRAEAAAVEDLDVDDSGVAWQGERVALVYRIAGDEPDPVANYPLLGPILKAGRQGTVVLVDEMDDSIAANKTILAAVSEELEAGRLPADMSAYLTGFVPWTRHLEEAFTEIGGERVDLPEWCVANRETLIIKPGSGYGGRGVTIGCEADDATWAAALDAALGSKEAWLVQRLARSHPTTTSIVRQGTLLAEQTYVDYGFFAIRDVVPAGIVRKCAPFGGPTRMVKWGGACPVYTI